MVQGGRGEGEEDNRNGEGGHNHWATLNIIDQYKVKGIIMLQSVDNTSTTNATDTTDTTNATDITGTTETTSNTYSY